MINFVSLEPDKVGRRRDSGKLRPFRDVIIAKAEEQSLATILKHLQSAPAAHTLHNPRNQPDRKDNDRAQQEVAPGKVDCIKAHFIDSHDQFLETVQNVIGAEAKGRQDDADDHRQNGQLDDHDEWWAAEELAEHGTVRTVSRAFLNLTGN